MSKPRSRSREYNRNNNVVDFEKAARQRKEKRRAAQARTEDIRQQAPERKKHKKKARKRTLIALIVLLVAAAVTISAVNIIRLEKQKHALEQEQSQLEQTLEDKKQELANVNDPEYIEKQVREKLNMVYPDEILYISPDEDKSKDED